LWSKCSPCRQRGGAARLHSGDGGTRCSLTFTVEEKSLTGAFTRRDGKAAIAQDLERVYAYFPRLRARRMFDPALYVGPAEQQMCVIGVR